MGLVVWGQELLQSWGVTPKDDRKPRPETCVFCAKIAARVADPASDDAPRDRGDRAELDLSQECRQKSIELVIVQM